MHVIKIMGQVVLEKQEPTGARVITCNALTFVLDAIIHSKFSPSTVAGNYVINSNPNATLAIA